MNRTLGLAILASLTALSAAAQGNSNKAADCVPVKITTVENVQATISLCPKELATEKSVPWRSSRGESDQPDLEFQSAEPRSMSIELMFDMFEEKGNVYEGAVKPLEGLLKINDKLKRPPMVVVTWGRGTPAFKGVVESLSVRYTMFLPDGTPCRATCTVRIKEAGTVTSRRSCNTTSDCQQGYFCQANGDGTSSCRPLPTDDH